MPPDASKERVDLAAAKGKPRRPASKQNAMNEEARLTEALEASFGLFRSRKKQHGRDPSPFG